jgi:hypothetical protein
VPDVDHRLSVHRHQFKQFQDHMPFQLPHQPSAFLITILTLSLNQLPNYFDHITVLLAVKTPRLEGIVSQVRVN